MSSEKRLADVDALLEEINRTIKIMEKQSNRLSIRNVVMCIKNAPTVDAVEVVHGRWVRRIVHHDNPTYWKDECSTCGFAGETYYQYCPNCGAKMDGDSNG